MNKLAQKQQVFVCVAAPSLLLLLLLGSTPAHRQQEQPLMLHFSHLISTETTVAAFDAMVSSLSPSLPLRQNKDWSRDHIPASVAAMPAGLL